MNTNPYYQDESVTLYHGDCLDVLSDIHGPFDAVITDPPYASGTRTEASKSSSGAMLRAGRFSDRPIDLDQMTTTGFVWLLRAVGQWARVELVEGGSLLSFIDWRAPDADADGALTEADGATLNTALFGLTSTPTWRLTLE